LPSSKSQRDLTILARSKSITIPTVTTDDARDAFENLNKKSGDDFDKEFIDMMVSNNKDAINTFEKASTDNHDSDIKNWATTTLYDLRKHLDLSIDCQQKTDDMAVRIR
jgi:putative membrane protein